MMLQEEMVEYLETNRVPDFTGNEGKPIEKRRKLGLDFEESDEEGGDESTRSIIEQEIEQYRKEPSLDVDLDPVESFWKKKQEFYPNLTRLVR